MVDDGYWERRKGSPYYKEVQRQVERFSPGESILDVGCANTPIVLYGDFETRHTVDLNTDPQLEGVTSFVSDFITWEPPKEKYSVVTCLQTLEHLTDEQIRPFVDKLFQLTGKALVVSIPWKWRKGYELEHLQDPIDEAKFKRIMGRQPDEMKIINKKKRYARAVTLFLVK